MAGINRLFMEGIVVKKRSIFQKGNICNAEWKARISDQMGSIKLRTN